MRSRIFSGAIVKITCLVCAVGLLAGGQARAQEADVRLAELQASAQAFVQLLAQGQFDHATKDFDDTMKTALPAAKLGEIWRSILQKAGPFQQQTGVRIERAGQYDIVFVTCGFAKASLDAKVVFNRSRQISGLFFVPVKSPKADYGAPVYVRREAFQETEVSIGSGEWLLPGSLALPNGQGPFPAVVLIHGSGPNDRNETIGPNVPFRDLALGLASRGIAVLRFEKRTKEHAAKLAALKDSLTVKEEVLDDALAAVAFLRRQRSIDGRRVFVLGHSLGAMLCPKIGTLDPDLAGLICLAGSTRPLGAVMADQVNYLLSLDPNMAAAEKEQLEKLKLQASRLADPNLSRDTPAAELPLGIGFAYWQSLRDNDPLKVVAQVQQPMLILQGERDYQVRMEDFEGWKKALASRTDVTFKSYPKLNHLFMEGEGPSKPAEYLRAGYVAQDVIEDIAGWITPPRGRRFGLAHGLMACTFLVLALAGSVVGPLRQGTWIQLPPPAAWFMIGAGLVGLPATLLGAPPGWCVVGLLAVLVAVGLIYALVPYQRMSISSRSQR